MKPNFALSLSFEGIRLLHRSGRSWQFVGDVPLDSADLSGALSVLRSTANALDKSGVRSKLILPNDQIRYLTLDHVAQDEGAVRAALEGATPYNVDDLVFDWATVDGKTHIAAVARETLDEAEQFATDHRFNPVCFVATPEPGDFDGEPYFGETRASAGLLDPGETVERDSRPPPPDADLPAVSEIGPVAAEDVAPDEPVAADSVAPPAADESPADPAEPADPALAVAVEEPPVPAPSFASIRASRQGDAAAAAPKLNGATRPGEAGATPEAPAPERKSATEGLRSRISFGLKLGGSRKEPEGDGDAAGEEAAAQARPKRKMLPLPEKRMARPEFADKPVPVPVEARVGGKPRFLGLVLTVVLLLFLAGVAAWAAIFVEDGLSRLWRSEPKLATPEVVQDIAATEAPEITPPDPTDGIDLARLEPAQDAAPEVIAEAAPAPRAATPEEAAAYYAVTGIWQRAPEQPGLPGIDTLETLYIVSLDGEVPELDALALPRAADLLTDAPLSLRTSPPAHGSTFALDENGMVIPTPEGAPSPDGFTVFLGKPPRVPPPTPERAAPEAQADAAPALAGFRPRLRPEDLVEGSERLELGGRTRAELASIRPKPRPAGLEAPPAAEAVAEASGTQDQAEPEAAEQPANAATLAFVTPPKKPKLRPDNLAERFSTPRETRVAAATAATVQPRIPSATSVTRAATVQNAINLRKVNLIGVYGKPNSRRALVRLKNGRYKKVKVGDRIDGGKVASIGSDKLNYTKNGRSISLTLP